jgi:cytochrome bd-type quinol oxidase subunit 2
MNKYQTLPVICGVCFVVFLLVSILGYLSIDTTKNPNPSTTDTLSSSVLPGLVVAGVVGAVMYFYKGKSTELVFADSDFYDT